MIEQLDLNDLVRQYAGRGSAAYRPAMLLGLLVYGYATGVHSSRKIERACHDSIAFRFIAADTQPDHDNIAGFRRRFLPQIEALFVQVLVLAHEMKCLKLGNIALDRVTQDRSQRQQTQSPVVGTRGYGLLQRRQRHGVRGARQSCPCWR